MSEQQNSPDADILPFEGGAFLVDAYGNETPVQVTRSDGSFGYFERYGREVGFNLRTGIVAGEAISATSSVVVSARQRERERLLRDLDDRERLLAQLHEVTGRHGWTNDLTTEQVRAVLDIVHGQAATD